MLVLLLSAIALAITIRNPPKGLCQSSFFPLDKVHDELSIVFQCTCRRTYTGGQGAHGRLHNRADRPRSRRFTADYPDLLYTTLHCKPVRG